MHAGSAFAQPPQAVMPSFADANGAPAHVNDVEPLLGQLEALLDQQPLDKATQPLWFEAVSLALTGQVSAESR